MARIAGAKGLAGAVRIELLTDWPEHLAAGALVYLEGEDRPRRVLELQAGGRVPAILLEALEGRQAAEAVIGRYLEVDAGELPEGSYYWHQLVGLKVVDEAGAALGEVVEVFRAGENEVYRVLGPDGAELLLPAVRDFVREIDLARGMMVVRYEIEEVR
ncbi:MAG TPA: ribosome maturation factor RimM [Candidatus Dormibacteraeota bacterium]|nr:ribosome maturation factor RimM [Candidatus Dormibacteraeota bacterium]